MVVLIPLPPPPPLIFQRTGPMAGDPKKLPELVKEVRKQLGISQEGLAHELGVSFATINRWKNGKTTPFKLAWAQFDAFLQKDDETGEAETAWG